MINGKVNHKGGTFGIPNEEEFSSTGMEDAPKYYQSEELEPLDNADHEFRKAIQILGS